MLLPPLHTAGVRAELLHPVVWYLHHGSAAVHTAERSGTDRMPANMGAYGVGRYFENRSNLPGEVTLYPEIVYSDFILWFHSVLLKEYGG